MSKEKLEIKKMLIAKLKNIESRLGYEIKDFSMIRADVCKKKYAIILYSTDQSHTVIDYTSSEFEAVISDLKILHQLCELNSEE